jgi:2-polyprenyl-3-methyl-5-hydroxy-6-metoxy-1,4-benzoquinol methylase
MGKDGGVTSHDHAHPTADHSDRFSNLAADWDERPGAQERATSVAAAIRAAIPLSRSMSALEIGGGTGLLSRALADDIGTAVVTDVAPGMVAAASRVLTEPAYAGWRAELFDVERDALPDERFDLVLSLLALHHMGDIPAVMERVVGLLAPGGQVALADLEHDAEGGFHRHVEGFDGHHGFTRERLTSLLCEAGLVDVAVGVAGHDTKEVEGLSRRFPILLATGRLAPAGPASR